MRRWLAWSLLLLVALAPALRGQQTLPAEQPRAAQYFLGNQDQVLMPVNVWGFVFKPGQYMVPYETDLISLLSFAGGPREEARIKNIKLVRPGSGEAKAQVIEIDVKEYLEKGTLSEIPVLRPGDTVIVSGTSFHFINQFFDFAVRIAALVQVWALVDFYRNN